MAEVQTDGIHDAGETCYLEVPEKQQEFQCGGIPGRVPPPALSSAGGARSRRLSIRDALIKEARTERPCTWAPEHCGALLWLADGACKMEFREEHHCSHIHPNIYVPASLEKVKELGGGGSGVTVLRATDAEFGDIVMKHCGHKDTAEIWALATLKAELKCRAEELNAQEAANDMDSRTPNFKFMYISQNHLRARSGELWQKLRTVLKAVNLMSHALSPNSKKRASKPICMVYLPPSEMPPRRVDLVDGRLEIYRDDAGVEAPVDSKVARHGIAFLSQLAKEMMQQQRCHSWKITMAQERIGGESPQTAAKLLLLGQLTGSTLERLADNLLRVIRNLQALTKPDEQLTVEQVREELATLERSDLKAPASLSAASDKFVGAAIKKNYHHERGRFKNLRDIGAKFRSGQLILQDSEKLPAQHLGALLQEDADASTVFTSGCPKTALDRYAGDHWYDLLTLATKLEGAQDCIWTCGLTDGGLHNMFLTAEKVWLFDLGEPTVMPIPAFLTKLLMSFFHVLGMEEEDGSTSEWVNRFIPGERLQLTDMTQAALAFAREAFSSLLSRLVADVFGGDEQVRELLLEYVVLQLLSDAAFCLERWLQKGGGEERWRQQALEKWLWRALWDLYAAGEVANSRCASRKEEDQEGTSSCGIL
mmetsp:Transcript_13645/g.31025  ORF Transcript_13645/g.31025 Transcript_13645/m.31025 type:complete len:651 (-) Transcript_13645:83-2035(-)